MSSVHTTQFLCWFSVKIQILIAASSLVSLTDEFSYLVTSERLNSNLVPRADTETLFQSSFPTSTLAQGMDIRNLTG